MSGNSVEKLAKVPQLPLENHIAANFRKKEYIFKILVLGDYGVGKTSIIKRYADDTFSSNYKITIGADFAHKLVHWDEDTTINLQLWDIAGHERFGCLTGVYYRHAVAAAIVFDLTRPDTFKSVEKWLLDLRKKISLPDSHTVPIIILANKGDITVEYLPNEIVNFCEKFNILAWFITSAKENVHINKAMITLMNAALKNHEKLQFVSDSDSEIVKLTSETNGNVFHASSQSCCQR